MTRDVARQSNSTGNSRYRVWFLPAVNMHCDLIRLNYATMDVGWLVEEYAICILHHDTVEQHIIPVGHNYIQFIDIIYRDC